MPLNDFSLLNRRALMELVALQSGLLATGGNSFVTAQAQPQQFNHFPRMVHDYLGRRVRESDRANLAGINRLQTKEDAQQYVLSVRKKIQTCFGAFPEKTPLNARVTGKVERDAYTIEKVLFESRPDFLVSANLYIPKGRKGPLPGVVGSCGHSLNGKAADAYQAFCQGLAIMGYVTLIFDPIGQGERIQYGHVEQSRRPRIGVGEHLHGGNQQLLVGEFFGSWRAWDGIRALDYLLTRPEVDPTRVGVTGNSGGGTMTTWLCGLEQRWTMAAPACFVTTFRRNFENELPADSEQCPPGILAMNLDHADFLAALAPKPIVILAKEKDFFDVRGSEEAFQKLKKLYTLLGAPENIKLYTGPTEHGYSIENREAMYQWFNQVTKISDMQKEPKVVVEKDETLWCTPEGQVAKFGSRSLFSFTDRKAKALVGASKKGVAHLSTRVKSVLKMPKGNLNPDYRILRSIRDKDFPKPIANVYAIETESEVFAIVYRLTEKPHDSRPPRSSKRAVLYVAHQSSADELRRETFVRELFKAEPDSEFFTCDVRGIGESKPDTCGVNQFLVPYGNDYFNAVHSLMLDSPYLGQKVLDVMGVLAWLRDNGFEDVHLAAKGWGTLPALFAAILDAKIKQVTLKNSLSSYRELACSECYDWPLSSMLPNVLDSFDLPECYAQLGGKLKMIDPAGAILADVKK
jgi:dienelactone hydrolase